MMDTTDAPRNQNASESDPKARYNQAGALFQQGDYQGALFLLEGLVRQYPEDKNLLTALRRVQERMAQKTVSAGQPFDRAIDDLVGPSPGGKPQKPEKNGFFGRRFLVGGIVGAAAILALIGGYIGLRQTSGEETGNALISGVRAITSSIMSSGTYDSMPMLEEQVGPGSFACPVPSDHLVSMVVPDDAYPDGKCTIWIPDDKAREDYLADSTFIPSPVHSSVRTATLDDVVKDKTKFGYFYSQHPPSFIPEIAYPDEKPIYPFVGQMVPGTDLSYTSPKTPAAWLVDIVDGKVVPALTTIDFRDFRSINWPRARYMEAIELAREGRADFRLSGSISDHPKFNGDSLHVKGTVRVSGDVAVYGPPGYHHKLYSEKGTVFVIDAKSSDNQFRDTPNLIWFILGGQHITRPTEQNPIIFTSNSDTPAGKDWFGMSIIESSQYDIENTLIEYALTGTLTFCNVKDSIIRYTEYDWQQQTDHGNGILIKGNNPSAKHNELHNNSYGINGETGFAYFQSNLIYNMLTTCPYEQAKGIFCASPQDTSNNIIVKIPNGWGIAAEDGTSPQANIHHNIIALNCIGIMRYYEPGFSSNPTISNNNIWWNWSNYTIPQGQPANIAKSRKHEVTHENDKDNESYDPMFRNIKIFDLYCQN